MDNPTDLSAEEMYRKARKGWFFSLFALIFQSIVSYFFMRSLMSSPDMPRPFIVADEKTILYIGIPLALAVFICGLMLKARFTRRGIDEQNRQLVLQGTIRGMQSSAMIATIGFALAILFWYQYFFVWCIFGVASVLFHFPRPQPFLDASYKRV